MKRFLFTFFFVCASSGIGASGLIADAQPAQKIDQKSPTPTATPFGPVDPANPGAPQCSIAIPGAPAYPSHPAVPPSGIPSATPSGPVNANDPRATQSSTPTPTPTPSGPVNPDNPGAPQAVERADQAAGILREITSVPDEGFFRSIARKANCVIVIPSVKKARFILGGRYARGYAACRTATDWSAPAPMLVSIGSFGAQIGGEGVDLVLLVMNEQGTQKLFSGKLEIGVDASAAAGPVSRSASASTDLKMNTEILSYSRTRGLFAGMDISGAKLKQDDDTMKELYGKGVSFKEILAGRVRGPSATQSFIQELQKDLGPEMR
jgi:SH3 domain-containing YSC84-like protein 1